MGFGEVAMAALYFVLRFGLTFSDRLGEGEIVLVGSIFLDNLYKRSSIIVAFVLSNAKGITKGIKCCGTLYCQMMQRAVGQNNVCWPLVFISNTLADFFQFVEEFHVFIRASILNSS